MHFFNWTHRFVLLLRLLRGDGAMASRRCRGHTTKHSLFKPETAEHVRDCLFVCVCVCVCVCVVSDKGLIHRKRGGKKKGGGKTEKNGRTKKKKGRRKERKRLESNGKSEGVGKG